MRTVTFKSVLDWVASKALGHPLLMGQEEAETYTRYINDAVRECWEREPWPEWSPIELRTYAPTYVDLPEAAPWPTGQLVYYEGSYWRALQPVFQDPPASDSLYWEEATDFDRVISLAQTYRLPYSLAATAHLAIGTLLGISRTNPRVTPRNFVMHEALFSPDGITVFDPAAGNSLWIHFRLPPPEFTATVWASGAHAVGDRVYYPPTGECYIALVGLSDGPVALAREDLYLSDADVTLASTAYTALPPNSAVGLSDARVTLAREDLFLSNAEVTLASTAYPGLPTSIARWQKIDFPYVLAPAVQRFAYADALEDDGQHDKAQRVREEGEERLGMEWQKAESQQGMVRTFRVLSRASSYGYTYAA